MPEKQLSSGSCLWPFGWGLVCLGLGITSGLSSVGGDGDWYKSLVRPPGTPPSWVFGPVWSALYLMMGVSLGRLINQNAWRAVKVFAIQLLLNLAWTPVFFGLHRSGVALVIIIAMWFGLLATILLARKVDKISAWLLIPYLAWVTYATYLNIGFFWLNGR